MNWGLYMLGGFYQLSYQEAQDINRVIVMVVILVMVLVEFFISIVKE